MPRSLISSVESVFVRIVYGAPISGAIRDCIAYAVDHKCQVSFKFNDVLVEVEAESDLEEKYAEWMTEFEKLRTENND